MSQLSRKMKQRGKLLKLLPLLLLAFLLVYNYTKIESNIETRVMAPADAKIGNRIKDPAGSIPETGSEIFADKVDETNYKMIMDQLNNEKVAQDDPRLIKLIRDYYLEPPSELSYNLTNPNRQDYSQGRSPIIDSQLNKMVLY